MTTDPIGGVWSYSLDLCRELGARGIDVALASMGRKLTASERARAQRLPRLQLFESAFKLEWMTDPWDDVAAAGEWLHKLAQGIRPSVIHLNQFSHGALAWNAPCLVVGHSCVYSWFEAVKGALPGAEWLEYRERVGRGLHGAAAVTAPSAWLLARLQHFYGDFELAEPIPNGGRAPCFAPAPKENIVLTAGRLWDEAKNIAILDALAPDLGWPIYAAGARASPDGGAPPLENLRTLGCLDSAGLAGWMSRASIFVLPARYEPFGLAALEAGLAGCALVLGDIPSLREIWRDAALFVDPRNSREIARALNTLIAHRPLRRRLAERARRRAGQFTARRMALAYLALYRRMLADARSPRPARFQPFSLNAL
jgi:glycosyltransferase involved in cell wall biosynthesis